jgi:hypothetical protein
VADVPAHRRLQAPEDVVRGWVATGSPLHVATIARATFGELADAVAEAVPHPYRCSIAVGHDDGCPCVVRRPPPDIRACTCETLRVTLHLVPPPRAAP